MRRGAVTTLVEPAEVVTDEFSSANTIEVVGGFDWFPDCIFNPWPPIVPGAFALRKLVHGDQL
jgi:hypothetical protein